MDIYNQNSALLVMDMQSAIIGQLPNYTEITDNVAKAISFARANEIPVLFVKVIFRHGMPEVSPNNKLFSASKERSGNANMDDLMKIDATVAPLPGDIVITKRRVSAFTGSDLEVVLRGLGIHHLILTGVATSGVVLSTLCEAADKDYRLTVLSDCCTDSDLGKHTVLVEKVFDRQSTVLSLADWMSK